MNTKLMDRIFSAMDNEEDAVLNQIEDDINVALEDGTCEAKGQYSIEKVDDNTVNIHDEVNDEDTVATMSEAGEINLLNPLGKRYEELMTACDTKSFANSIKDGKFVARIGSEDIIFDLKKNVAYNADDERQHWAFSPNSKFLDVLGKIEKELKSNKMDKKVRTFTARHIADHKNNDMMDNISNLSPELQDWVKKEYGKRFNKTRNFAKAK